MKTRLLSLMMLCAAAMTAAVAAPATYNRADFGVDMGKAYGFNMDVTLRIQIEALAADAAAAKK